MELIRRASVPVLSNSGIVSEQLLFPENSASERLTITRVSMPPGSINPRHLHAASEQVWIAISGEGILLLAEDKTEPFSAGDVARFADGDVHGFKNTGSNSFVYLSITSPPINFRDAYAKDWGPAIARSEA